MIDAKSLETLSVALGVKGPIIEADIKDLAWVWEETIRGANSTEPRLAFYVLRGVSRSYLRGRNLRMGNFKGLWRHEWTEVGLMTILVRYVSEETVFGCLHKAGVTSVKSFTSALNSYFDILNEANRILEEGGNYERGRH